MDAEASAALDDLEQLNLVDIDEFRAVWAAALSLPAWEQAPVWVHGDLNAGNILVLGAELTAVIDFGGLGVGDPACDLLPGWLMFEADAREAFFASVAPDDATWERGRAWAFAVSLFQLPYYYSRRPDIAKKAVRALGDVLGHPLGVEV